jgi:hypothetical protein
VLDEFALGFFETFSLTATGFDHRSRSFVGLFLRRRLRADAAADGRRLSRCRFGLFASWIGSRHRQTAYPVGRATNGARHTPAPARQDQ